MRARENKIFRCCSQHEEAVRSFQSRKSAPLTSESTWTDLKTSQGLTSVVFRCIHALRMNSSTVTANGKEVPVSLPCSLHDFLVAQSLLPRSVVVEHNGEAVAPSEFANRQLNSGDRLEVVKIVAGG